jgi:hypothetical protein
VNRPPFGESFFKSRYTKAFGPVAVSEVRLLRETARDRIKLTLGVLEGSNQIRFRSRGSKFLHCLLGARDPTTLQCVQRFAYSPIGPGDETPGAETA